MHKHGLPSGMSEEDVFELRAKIVRIKADFDEWLADPVEQAKLKRFARMVGTIRPCDLERQFTI